MLHIYIYIYIYIKQHLSNTWSSIHEKVKKALLIYKACSILTRFFGNLLINYFTCVGLGVANRYIDWFLDIFW